MTPVFLISLPRAGSTMLQRILMSHPEVASKSEPWLMLPLIYMLRQDGLVSEYGHRNAYRAVIDFTQALPQGKQDYYESLRHFACELYQKQCSQDEQYFLDKTPRYYLIIKELAEIFPEAKFILLVRNPLQVISSIIRTFSYNNLSKLHFYQIDMLQGFHKMAEGIEWLGERAIVVKYEDIIKDQERTLDRLFKYLLLPWEPTMVEALDDRGLEGRLGDQVGTYQYQKIVSKGTQKWKDNLNERVRKSYIKSVIDQLDSQKLAIYGYEKTALLQELQQLKTNTTLQSLTDLRHIASSKAIIGLYLNLYRKRVKNWSEKILIH